MKSNLRPCPFCGGRAVLEQGPTARVQCDDCHCGTSRWGKAEWAAERWNTRPDNYAAIERAADVLAPLTGDDLERAFVLARECLEGALKARAQ
jgi:hypothetical protein